MDLSVFGLGYVGTVTAACLADLGHRVIGVDIQGQKVDMVRDGKSPVIERDLPDLVRDAVDAGRLKATQSTAEAIQQTDISLICVGTPSADNGSLSEEALRQVLEGIGREMAQKTRRHLVVVRSTVLPGTCARLVLPILEESSGLIRGEGFGLAYNPEFLREGSSVDDFYQPPKTVIGALEEEDGQALAAFYQTIEAPLFRTRLEVAEMIKYVDNPFHALKVAFANEVGALCQSLGVDAHEVIDIFLEDRKLNVSPAYLRPGFAFGGSCLPKDLRALLYCAKTRDLELPLLASVLPSNDVHLARGLSLVLGTGSRRVGLVGLSFKAGTDDLRESPYVRMAESLLGKGIKLRILDEHVSMARLTGANRRYIEGEIPHVAELLLDSEEELLEFAEVVVLSRATERERELLPRLRQDQIAVDLAGIRDGARLCGGRYLGLTSAERDIQTDVGAELAGVESNGRRGLPVV